MDLASLDAADIAGPEAHRQRPRYREILIERGLAREPGDAAFVDLDGRPLGADALGRHIAQLRSVRINMEASGALCRALLDARDRTFDPETMAPTLHDFMLDRVPPRAGAGAGA